MLRRHCWALILESLLGVVFLSACVSDTPAPDSLVPRWVYPATRETDVVDDYHGVKVADPYRWLEDDNSPETKAWVEAQNTVTFGYLRQIPELGAVRARLTKLWNYERYGVPFKQAGRYVFTKNDGLQNQGVLYTLTSLDAPPAVLLDPNTLSSDGTVAMTSYAVSDDGNL
jgi:prolyl oligopeptidase